MSLDKSKYSIYLLNKKTPSYSGSSKSPISFAKMFIKNCNLKNKSITFYVKNSKNKKVYGPYLGNVNTKTVKLQKNKQRGGVKIDDDPLKLLRIDLTYNQNFLKPSLGLGILSDKNLCFTINLTYNDYTTIKIYCKKNIIGNNFEISTDGSFDKVETDSIEQAKLLLMKRMSMLMTISDMKRSLNTTDAVEDQVTLKGLEEHGITYPLNFELYKLYKKKALRTAYDELCKMYVDRHLGNVSQFISKDSFALLPNSLSSKYKISFSVIGRNPHIFFMNLKNVISLRNPLSYEQQRLLSTRTSSYIGWEINRYFGGMLYKGSINKRPMFAALKISSDQEDRGIQRRQVETIPNFKYEIHGYYDLTDPANSRYVPSQENLVIIRDAISEYRRVYNNPTFASTIFDFVNSKILPPPPLEQNLHSFP